jgi:hypothetical protein
LRSDEALALIYRLLREPDFLDPGAVRDCAFWTLGWVERFVHSRFGHALQSLIDSDFNMLSSHVAAFRFFLLACKH